MEMAKMVLCGVLGVLFVLQIILRVIKKPNRLFYASADVVELVISTTMLTLDIITGDDIWIAWAICVAIDITLLTRKIMKDEQIIQTLKGIAYFQQNAINFQQRIIEEQQLELNNSNKANTEH